VPLIAPVYPLLSGGFAAIAQIGHATPFPSASALGPHCNHAFPAIASWAHRSGALTATTWFGCVGWLILLAGLVSFLRTAGRGRCGWEPATVIFIACLAPVWMCVQDYFHPQDLVALGLSLVGLALARKGSWVACGIVFALATLSHQFALLVAAPLFVIAPARARWRYALAGGCTATALVVPLLAISSGSASRSILVGSGNTASIGGTWVWELQLHGATLVLLSRVAPILTSIILAWWVARHLGTRALHATPLVALMAVSLSLRLIFEQNLFGYYFMALATMLVLLDVVRGQIRGPLIAWLAMVTLVYALGPTSSVFFEVTWGGTAQDVCSLVILAVVLVAIAAHVLRSGLELGLLVWVALVAGGLIAWPAANDPLYHYLPTWFWQVVLVTPGVALGVGPLLQEIRGYDSHAHPEVVDLHEFAVP
jgi:hypothetical protein